MREVKMVRLVFNQTNKSDQPKLKAIAVDPGFLLKNYADGELVDEDYITNWIEKNKKVDEKTKKTISYSFDKKKYSSLLKEKRGEKYILVNIEQREVVIMNHDDLVFGVHFISSGEDQ